MTTPTIDPLRPRRRRPRRRQARVQRRPARPEDAVEVAARTRCASSTRARCGATRSCSSSRSAPVLTTVLGDRRPVVVRLADRRLAVADGVFANLAEAVAEGRGKAQAETLRRTKTDTMARRLAGWTPGVPAARKRSRRRSCSRATSSWSRPARSIPGDGDVVEGIAVGRRVGHHRRVRAGHPRVRRRPLGGHRRHQGAVRPDRRQDHRRSRARASSTG